MGEEGVHPEVSNVQPRRSSWYLQGFHIWVASLTALLGSAPQSHYSPIHEQPDRSTHERPILQATEHLAEQCPVPVNTKGAIAHDDDDDDDDDDVEGLADSSASGVQAPMADTTWHLEETLNWKQSWRQLER